MDTRIEMENVKKKVPLKKVVATGRRALDEGKCHLVAFRKEQLQQLRKMYTNHKEEFLQALKTDLRKPELESILMELHYLLNDIDHILKRIDQWTKSEKVPSQVPLDKSIIYNDPYGLVLVLGAWNFPLQLSMLPVHGAIAAGNAVIVKPSEVAPATADLLAKLVPKFLHRDYYQVVLGGVKETTELLTNRFDYIFYTGSPGVGKIIRDAANKFLTPCTLELGGKSPCFIDESVDLDMAVRRIIWGKLVNLGQVCIAPDYLICSAAMQGKFVNKAKEIMLQWYGENPKESESLGRIVVERHVDRLAALLDSGTIAHGGKYDKESKWFEPTILTDVAKDSQIMREEIFGPIMPIVTFENPTEAIQYINKGEKPLALYVFTTNKELQNLFVRKVSSGGVCINDIQMQIGNPKLPFGGVGNSGMGQYHGKYSFDTFTHKKSVLYRSYNKIMDKGMGARFPPYTPDKIKMLTMSGDKSDGPGVLRILRIIITHLVCAFIGASLFFVYYYISNENSN